MKRLLFFLSVMLTAVTCGFSQNVADKFSYHAELHAGFPLSESNNISKGVTIGADYAVLPRLRAGMGMGFKHIHQILMPLYANVQWDFVHPRRFTPYLEGLYGYACTIDQRPWRQSCRTFYWHALDYERTL